LQWRNRPSWSRVQVGSGAAGSRLIEPNFGVSLFVRTSLVTVTLVALAFDCAVGCCVCTIAHGTRYPNLCPIDRRGLWGLAHRKSDSEASATF